MKMREPAPSIRRRLLALLLIPTALVGGAATWSACISARAPLEAAYDRELVDAALAIAGSIRGPNSPSPRVSLTPDAVRMLRWDTLDTIYFRVSGGDGRFIAGDQDLPVPHQAVANPAFDDATYRGQPIRMASYRVTGAGGAAIVTVAETLHKRALASGQVLRASLAVDAAQLVTALIVIWFGVRFAIAPLRNVERQIAARGARDLAPLSIGGVPVEIRSLIGALNRLLGALQDAGQAERAFLENAAHQLRTPLTGMLAHLELLAGSADSPDARRLGPVLLSARRLARTTRQLLSLARSDAAGRMTIEWQRVSLPALVESCAASHLAAADQGCIELGAELQPADIRGSRWLLEEALGNLLDNAIAATPAGGSITLRCGARGDRACIEVTDSGVGIPAQERARVFDRFYRASNAGSEGSGLGLAIVREVAAAHGAELVLDAASGGGTVARMIFPLSPAPAS